MNEKEQTPLPSRSVGTTSVQLVVMALIAALVVTMAIPAFSQIFSMAGQLTESQY